MSQIQQALGGLWEALDKLGEAADQQEQKFLQIRQQELFNSRAADEELNCKPGIDSALVTRQLDLAIGKIEQVLQEG